MSDKQELINTIPGTEVDLDNTRNKSTENGDKHRGYFLTINNFSEKEKQKVVDEMGQVVWGGYKVEKVDTLHLHVVLYYKNPRKWPKRKFPRANIQVLYDFDGIEKYMNKEETTVEKTDWFGTKPVQGQRTDIKDLFRRIEEDDMTMRQIALEDPGLFLRCHNGIQKYLALKKEVKPRFQMPYVEFRWGKTGVGKTRYVYDNFKPEEIYSKDLTKWWDGYCGQKVILIDDFRGSSAYFTIDILLKFLDRYPFKGEVKGGYVEINSPMIFITSDSPPNDLWQHDDHLRQVLRRISKVVEVE